MASNILVYVEHRGAKILPATFQLIHLAQQLATSIGGDVEACIVGSNVGSLADEVAKYGVKKTYIADNPELENYRAMAQTQALAAVIDAAQPKLVLMPTTALGRDLASRIGARKRAAMMIDCTEAAYQGDDLVITTTLYCGKIFGKFKLTGSRLQVVTIRSNVFPAAAETGGSAETVAVDVALRPQDTRMKFKELAGTSSGVKDVTEGEIVVSGGRAMKSEENFKIIYELAETLDGAVGASRAACDAGYQPHTRQVGLTGKVVTPALYIACGIDGAIQHLAGMRGSKVIVAINTKQEAPIFKVANYGCVADLFVMVPLITQEFKKLLA